MYKKYLVLSLPIMLVFVVCTAIASITSFRLTEISSEPNIKFTTAAERDRQLTCLAQNIYHEAATEPFEGKVAVAQVTLNRTESRDFPNDVCAVVYQKNRVIERTVCQFSWFCNQPSQRRIRSEERYAESMTVARKVLLEGFKLTVLEDALYYHADYVNPGWKKQRIIKIGHHIFYEG